MAPSELDSHGRMYTLWKARPVLSRNAWDQFACDSVPLRTSVHDWQGGIWTSRERFSLVTGVLNGARRVGFAW